MKNKSLIFFLLVLPALVCGQTRLSEKATISLITCSPGKLLYEAFGHSGLRVKDPESRLDIIFNYGTFDFEQPDFYSNYAKGRPLFMLSVSQTSSFINSYVYENRTVSEDALNLTPAQNQRLFDLLRENFEPQNRNYRYDYIYDNCATRIRDIVAKTLEGAVRFDSTHITKQHTFRELMDLYLQPQPWGDLAIDLALSSVIDTPARPYGYMFLPDFLQKAFQNAAVTEGDSSYPLVKKSEVIYSAKTEQPENALFTPLVLAGLVLALFIFKTLFDFRKEKISVFADVVLFVVTGLTGAVIAYISFFSDHHAARNYNLLWAFPAHALFGLLLPFRKKLKRMRYYFLAAALLCALALAGSFIFIPQKFNTAVYPLMLTLILRGWMMSRKRVYGG